MIPVIPKYITTEYIDNATMNLVSIKDDLKSELNAVARKAVRMYRNGKKIVWANILDIEGVLLIELESDGAPQ